MQKTLTVHGKRFTGGQIAALMSTDNMTNGDDYIVRLNGDKFFANYRDRQDNYFAPVCDQNDANAIALCPDDGSFSWPIWIEYSANVSAAAAALGQHGGQSTSPAKAEAARENGRKGGRPRKA